MDGYKPRMTLHSAIHHPLLRQWNSMTTKISAQSLIYPMFVVEEDDCVEEVESMPGIMRYGVNVLVNKLQELVQLGLKSVLLFGVIKHLPKDEKATNADSAESPVVKAIEVIRQKFPDLVIICDVCLCAYTCHGHCGILKKDGHIDNLASINRIQQVALSYARHGCHMVAPSDMMDGRVGAIKQGLISAGLSRVGVLSYAAKFCSCFYGPFRDAAKSAPAHGDRKSYQLPPGSRGLAMRAVIRDVEEGADFLMVKPGLPYLDIVRQTKDAFPNYPLFVYQVSGEYSMLYHGAKSGGISLRNAVEETLVSFYRAGADCIITYFTPLVLEWLSSEQ